MDFSQEECDSMRKTSFHGSICPVARSLDSIGEWWSLLIIRDAMLGVRRFNDFQRRLGMARNVLSARLKKLVANGIMAQIPVEEGSPYQEYVLTEKGEALLPVLIALRQWGDRFQFAPEEPRTILVDKKRGKQLKQMQVYNEDGEQCMLSDLALATFSPDEKNHN
jgi:DNA-binding HxlR family transcriptional regulator